MTNPTPEAVSIAALVLVADVVFDAASDHGHSGLQCDPKKGAWEAIARDALAFIRDAIHRDGPDADAIRQALGLRREGLSYEGGAFPSRYRVVGYWMDDEA